MIDTMKVAGMAGPPGLRRVLMGAALAGTLAAGPAFSAAPPAVPAQTPPQATPSSATPPAASTQAAPPASRPSGIAAVGDKVDQTLSKVGATDEQKAKIKSILITALGGLMPLQPKAKQLPGRLEALLTAPKIDRAGLEQLRAGIITDLDQASKTLFQALADAADTLTPDQRAKLAAQLAPKPRPHP
jgi:Spy/CpxP family protein refolding chaperone